MIRFRCPVCAKTLKIHEDLAGKRVTCPRCRELAVAPVVASEPRPESLHETPGFFAAMSGGLRWTVAFVATAGGLGLLTAVLGPPLGGDTWITHGGMAVTCGSILSLLTVLHGHATGCPCCGRWWSRTRVRSDIGEKEVFVRGGTTFGRSVTRTDFKCAGCGHTWSVTDSEEYRVPEPGPTQRHRK
jgi:phage FluMu protein Com